MTIILSMLLSECTHEAFKTNRGPPATTPWHCGHPLTTPSLQPPAHARRGRSSQHAGTRRARWRPAAWRPRPRPTVTTSGTARGRAGRCASPGNTRPPPAQGGGAACSREACAARCGGSGSHDVDCVVACVGSHGVQPWHVATSVS